MLALNYMLCPWNCLSLPYHQFYPHKKRYSCTTGPPGRVINRGDALYLRNLQADAGEHKVRPYSDILLGTVGANLVFARFSALKSGQCGLVPPTRFFPSENRCPGNP